MKASPISLGHLPLPQLTGRFLLQAAQSFPPPIPPTWLPLCSISPCLTQASLPSPLPDQLQTPNFLRDSEFTEPNPDLPVLPVSELSFGKPPFPSLHAHHFDLPFPSQEDLYPWNSCKKAGTSEVVLEVPFQWSPLEIQLHSFLSRASRREWRVCKEDKPWACVNCVKG